MFSTFASVMVVLGIGAAVMALVIFLSYRYGRNQHQAGQGRPGGSTGSSSDGMAAYPVILASSESNRSSADGHSSDGGYSSGGDGGGGGD